MDVSELSYDERIERLEELRSKMLRRYKKLNKVLNEILEEDIYHYDFADDWDMRELRNVKKSFMDKIDTKIEWLEKKKRENEKKEGS
jgi:hypothetical protein